MILKKQKNMIFLSLLGVLIFSYAYGESGLMQPLPKKQGRWHLVQTTSFKYWIDSSTILKGTTARLLAHDAYLGRISSNSGAVVDLKDKHLGEAIELLLKHRTIQRDSVSKAHKQPKLTHPISLSEISKEVREKIKNIKKLSVEKKSINKTHDLALFTKCAQRTIPILMSLLNADKTIKDLAVIAHLKNKINRERGNGSDVGAGGIACGKYLGALGVASISDVDDIKILLALNSREASERNQLLKALVAARHKKAPHEATSLWLYYWHELSFAAYFKKPKALPEIEDLKKTLLEKKIVNEVKIKGRTMSVEITYKDIDLSTQLGDEFASQMMN